MRLQTVHNELSVPEASSLYCVWIQAQPYDASPLVAVWIDREMRTFERGCGDDAWAGAEVRTESKEETTMAVISVRVEIIKKEDQTRR